MLYSSYPFTHVHLHSHAQLQSDINVQEFVLELLEETRIYENNKKVRLCSVQTHRQIGSIIIILCRSITSATQCDECTCTSYMCISKLENSCLQLQFLAGMSEKIVQGIEAAESDLSKEKEKKSHEEVGGPIIYKQ